MISKNITKLCNDYKNIENYELAINDSTQIWDCHHRFETAVGLTSKQLKECGLYYDRPACELVFLTHGAHSKLHCSGEFHPMCGKHQSEEAKRKQKQTWKEKYENGYVSPMIGHVFSEERNKKISEALKGTNSPMYGKPPKNKGKHKVWDNKELNKFHYE